MDEFLFPIGDDAVEAGSARQLINATAHLAKAGDVIRFTSGNRIGLEARVRSVTTDAITLVESLNIGCSTNDTFQIFRPGVPKRAFKAAAASSTTELLAAVVGKALRVIGLVQINPGATVLASGIFKSATTAISAAFGFNSNGGGMVLPECKTGWLQTASGEALNFTETTGGTQSFLLLYVEL